MTTAADRADAFFASQAARVRSKFYDAHGRVMNADAEIARYGHRQPKAFTERVKKARGQAIAFADDNTNKWLLGLLDLVAPAVATAFREIVVPLAEHAILEWPVKTGESRDGLVLGFQYDEASGKASATFYGMVPYTWFVRYSLVRATASWQRAAALGGGVLALSDRRISQIRGANDFRVHVFGRIRQIESNGQVVDNFVLRIVADEFNTSLAYVRRIWDSQNTAYTQGERKYTGPDGEVVAGQHAWTVQVYRPGMDATTKIADRVVEAMRAA